MKHTQSRRNFLAKTIMGTCVGAGAGGLAAFGAGLEAAVAAAPKASTASSLKITDVKCGYIRNGNGLFVKVHIDQGIWGCGEGVDAVAGTYHLVKMFGARLKGQNPLNVG